jgi:hypothetical protein
MAMRGPGRGVSRTRTGRGSAPARGSRRASASGAAWASGSPSESPSGPVRSAGWRRSSRPGSGTRWSRPPRCRTRSARRRDSAPEPGSTTLPVRLRVPPQRGPLRARPRARGTRRARAMVTRRMARPGHQLRSCRTPRRARRRTRVPRIDGGCERTAIGTSDLAPWTAGRWRLLADSRRCARATCYADGRPTVSRPATRGRAPVGHRVPCAPAARCCASPGSGSAPSRLPALGVPGFRRWAFWPDRVYSDCCRNVVATLAWSTVPSRTDRASVFGSGREKGHHDRRNSQEGRL